MNVLLQCSQGRAAWQERERERRCSLTEAAQNHRVKQTEAHHRWMKRNRIHDTSYGGSSDEEDFFSVYYQSAAANALLYVGLGTTVIGLVIWFVGTGEKGFKTLELRLIGPTLIAVGLLCCVIRVLLCICPSTCFRRRKKTRLKNTCPHRFNKETRREQLPPTEDFVMVDHNTSLLGKNKKRVSIAPNPVPCTSTSGDQHHHHHPQHHHHHLQDSLVAATTVFLQHEKDRALVSKPIPTIEIPDFADFNSDGVQLTKNDSLIELQTLELSSVEVSSVSSCDSDSITIIEAEITRAPSKLMRTRQPKLMTSIRKDTGSSTTGDVTETSLSTPVTTTTRPTPAVDVIRPVLPKGSHSGIVLSPSKLGQ
ncbi:uncharacterized protein CBL_09110 [Carabus blaptoides fortunei]